MNSTKDKARKAAHYQLHKEAIRVRQAAYRATHKEEKRVLSIAYRAEHKAQTQAYNAVYGAVHKEERAAYMSAYYAAHRDKCLANSAAYYAAHRQRIAERIARYHAEHPGRIAARSAVWRKRHRKQIAMYLKAPAVRAARCAAASRRRAKMCDASPEEHVRIGAIYEIAACNTDVRCFYCGRRIAKGTRHVDHIVPLARGGRHAAGNLAIACSRCNVKKGARLPESVGLLPFVG